jgi:predicted carbohydrate-binding protein with CBM5 and CBM33 domain
VNRRRFALAVAPLAALPVLAVLSAVPAANAHGSMQNPASRTYTCYLEGPESPDSAACRAAIAVGGTQPLYDWHEVHILNAAGRHRQLIPDGELCSAGLDKYAGFDLPRADWPATTLPAGGGSYTFSYRATAPHRGSFEFYLTRAGYNPLTPLRWSDLEATPFLRATDPPLSGGAYVMTGQLPAGRTGRHLIYTIWQRSDSPEAFYTCSDVVFGTAPPTSPSPSVTASPTPSPTVSPSPPGDVAAWQPNTAYVTGARVSYAGATYQCRQAHTSLPGWEPPNVPALWQRL